MKKLILTFGHSIVRQVDSSWIPSEIYQCVCGLGEEISRTFIQKADMDPNGDAVCLGGGQIAVRALLKLWMLNPEAEIAIVGGRPHNMDQFFDDEVKDICEASVMADYFYKVEQNSKNNERSLPSIKIIGETRTTEDDILKILEYALNFSQIIVVAMSFRLFRARLLMEQFAQQNSKFSKIISDISFCNAEQFFPELLDSFLEMNLSKAYQRTMLFEKKGVQAKLKNQKEYSRIG